jgi:DNA modification methylase
MARASKYAATEQSGLRFVATSIEHWSLERLSPYSRNARTHSDEQVAQIAASIKEFGFVNPILVGPDEVIVAGHARQAAARKLGLTEVPVIVVDGLNESQRRALALADNRLPLEAGWDEAMLRIEIQALQDADYDLHLVGFDDEELRSLLAQQDAIEGLTDEDAVPELPEKPVSVIRDLWLLGDHRLSVSDATVCANAERLMANERADLIFSDPPFNVSVQGYTKKKLTILNDDMPAEEFRQFLLSAFSSYKRIVKPGASVYICHSSSWQREFQNALEAAGFEVRCQIIWAKNTFAWGFGRYKFQHEPIFYSHVAGQKDAWYGDKSQSTLWEEKKPAANRIHPTSKPVELVERALINSSKSGDIVADFFGGSGSTLISCERRGRRARLMELDPKYADCIVQRWQEYTGKKATLEGSDATFDEIAAERAGGTA